MLSNQNLLKEPIEYKKMHYTLVAPLQFSREMQKQLSDVDVLIIERIGNQDLTNPIDPDLIDALGSTYLVYCTPEQAKKASMLSFVESIEFYKPFYPREKIQSILKMNITLTIHFFCTLSSLLEEHLKPYMRLAKDSDFKDKYSTNKLSLFSISANHPDDIKMIDEIAKIEEVRSIEYSSCPILF